MKKITFEDYLREKFWETNPKIKLPDNSNYDVNFNNWLGNLDPEEWLKFGEEYKLATIWSVIYTGNTEVPEIETFPLYLKIISLIASYTIIVSIGILFGMGWVLMN